MVMDRIALILVIIGALNWGSVGIFGFDIVAYICGGQLATVSRVIFTLVGLCGPLVHFPAVQGARRTPRGRQFISNK